MLSKQEFIDEMERQLHQRLVQDHEIVAELEKPPGNPELLRMFALQGYQLTKNFARYVGGLYHNCPIEEFRIKLAINLFEEETGRMSKSDNHLKLMQNFLHGIGITDEEMERATPLPDTLELIDFRWNLLKDPKNFHRAAAAIAIASEGQNLEQKAGRATKDLLPKVYGVAPEALQFFTIHATEDVYHVQDGLQIVAGVCTDERMQQEALQAIHDTCDRFDRYFAGVLRAYRAADVSKVA